MARQIPSTDLAREALKSHHSYYGWLCEKSGISGPLAQLFYSTDFRWVDGIKDDENREKDALSLRNDYAISLLTGDKNNVLTSEEWRNVDRVKKSILGPACVFEVFVKLAQELNDMLNMDEENRTSEYFERLMMNVGFNFYDDEDYDSNPERVEKYWKEKLDTVLDRIYLPDGEGGLFPLDMAGKSPEEIAKMDQRKRSLWEQMNDWVVQEMDENTDEDEF